MGGAPRSSLLGPTGHSPRKRGETILASWVAGAARARTARPAACSVGRACAFAALLACTGACDLFGDHVECSFGAEQVVARTVAKELSAIDLVAVGDGAVALWSDPAGLFARRLDRDGRPTGEPTRVGLPCDGGVAGLVERDGRIAVACLARPSHDDKEPRAGAAFVHALDADLAIHTTTVLGPAGAISHGIAIADGPSGAEVVWHDGAADAQRVRWAALDGKRAARVVSDEAHVASAPAITRTDAGTLAVWTEHRLRADAVESQLFGWSGGPTKPRLLAHLRHLAPTPSLAHVGGRVVVGFRDQPSVQRKAGLYLAPLSPDGDALGARVRLGRADGVSAPDLVGCLGGAVAAVPRTYGGDHFIGVHWIEAALAQRRGGQQFYEDAHAYTQTATACLGNRALLLVAEHGMLDASRTALRAVTYTCR